MDALSVYQALLRELDKFESPTFTVAYFNYFIYVTISKYITDNSGDFDVLQKDLDDISALLVYYSPLTFTDATAPLPQDYRHSLGLELTLNFIADTNDYKTGDVITVYPKRLKTNRRGYTADNAYQKPSHDSPTYQLDSSNVYVRVGDDVTVDGGKMDYIKIPDTMYLNPDRSSDYTRDINNTPAQFSDYVMYEIIKQCRIIFLENIESPRYNSSLQNVQLDKMKE